MEAGEGSARQVSESRSIEQASSSGASYYGSVGPADYESQGMDIEEQTKAKGEHGSELLEEDAERRGRSTTRTTMATC